MRGKGRSSFQLFGKESDAKRNRYALKLAKRALALQMLGDLPNGKDEQERLNVIEEFVKQGLVDYDANPLLRKED